MELARVETASGLKLSIENGGLDDEARDVVVDGKLRIHIKRSADGYAIDFIGRYGHLLLNDGVCFFNEDLDGE